jgi:hypothetical protein
MDTAQRTTSSLEPALTSLLQGEPGASAWAILDGSLVPNLPGLLSEFASDHACLYRGELTPSQRRIAPYLFRVDCTSDLYRWLVSNGWDSFWGIYFNAASDSRVLRRHFRQFIQVRLPEEPRPAFFRYYDPRVLAAYLPSCEKTQAAQFFGPVRRFYMRGPAPQTITTWSMAPEGPMTETISV